MTFVCVVGSYPTVIFSFLFFHVHFSFVSKPFGLFFTVFHIWEVLYLEFSITLISC